MIHQYKLNGYTIVLPATPALKLPTCWQRNMLTIPK